MDYVKYYENQSGRGLPVFRGAKIQRGYGLGNLFRSFFRWIAPILKTHALPVLKEGAKTLGTETVKAVANVATDAITGKNMENVVKDRSEEYIKSLIAKTLQGSGIKKKKKSKISQSSNKITIKKKRS